MLRRAVPEDGGIDFDGDCSRASPAAQTPTSTAEVTPISGFVTPPAKFPVSPSFSAELVSPTAPFSAVPTVFPTTAAVCCEALAAPGQASAGPAACATNLECAAAAGVKDQTNEPEPSTPAVAAQEPIAATGAGGTPTGSEATRHNWTREARTNTVAFLRDSVSGPLAGFPR